MDVEYREMPALRVAAVPHQGPYHQIAEAFGRLGQVAAAAGLQDAPVTMLAIYYDDPAVVPVAELRSDAGMALAEDVALPPGLVERRLPAGLYAMSTYVGPYQFLGEAWAALRQQLASAGAASPDGAAAYEIYRNTPEVVPAAKLLTELYVPVLGSPDLKTGRAGR